MTMPIKYRYDPALHAVVTTVTGIADGSDAIANLEKVLNDDELPDGFIDIVDLSGADDISIEPSDAATIISMVSSLRTKKGLRGTVFFAPSDQAFAIAQMFKAGLGDSGITAKVLRDWDQLSDVVMERLRESP
jgi:hypothetical protein